MKQFLLGFLTSSVIFIFLLYAQGHGQIEIFNQEPEQLVQNVSFDTDQPDTENSTLRKKGRRHSKKWRKRKNRGQGFDPGPGYEQGEGVTGDDLSQGSRQMNGAGEAEQQLTSSQIDNGINRVFNGIQRCLMLMPSDAPSTGKIVIGMNITSGGNVTKVNLKGPKSMIKNECGACIRRQVKSIRFPPFDGPDMIANYPVTFD